MRLFYSFKAIILIIILFLSIQINSIGQTDNNSEYGKAIASGEKYITEKEYINAKASFQYAAKLFPDKEYPKKKIAEVLELIKAQQLIRVKYNKKLKIAKEYFYNKEYENAKIEFNNALKVLPNEKYPVEKIEEINNIFEQEKSNEAAYQKAINEGNKYLKSNSLNNAIAEYEKAGKLKPSEKFPAEKINEIKLLISKNNKDQKTFNEAIEEAEKLFSIRRYSMALIEFNKAAKIKPDEIALQKSIEETEKLAIKQESYDKLIEEADNLYVSKKYQKAKEKYLEAEKSFPEQTYPQEIISKIDQVLIKKNTDNQKQFDDLIAEGDIFMLDMEYQKAIGSFSNALNYKPEEQYPKDKITEINSILTDQKSTQENYEKAIASADNFFSENNLEDALTEYQNALNFKSEEQYPKDKITEINSIFADQKSTQENYEKAIASADNFFSENNLENALTEYQNALNFKAEEQYPKDKITEINSILADQKLTQENYEKAIAVADNYFSENNLENALAEYQNALNFKAEEQYPKDKITEINSILAEQKSTQENYEKAIAAADNFFSENNLENALIEYQNALNFKSEEQYPKDKITEINSILADQKSTKENYEKAIAAADNYFSENNLENALTEYQNALNFKSEEQYPKDRITEINSILADQKSTQENYEKAIAVADNYFSENNLENALAEYQNALNFKSEEQYPKDKITEINNVLAKQKIIEDNYQKAIDQADKLFYSMNYAQAIGEYQKALIIKPNDNYADDKIVESYAFIEQKENESKYNTFVSQADKYYDLKKYEDAKTDYKKAGKIFPDKPYISKMIKKIEDIQLEKRLLIQREYKNEIAKADHFFTSKIFDNAIESYKTAQKIAPEETYPSEMIEKITKIIMDNAIVEVCNTITEISNNSEKKFFFEPVFRKDRKNNYILLRARNLGKSEFKIVMNYGQNNSKNGGFVLKVPENDQTNDFIIRIGNQYNWFSLDNNWISIYPESGNLEVELIQISNGI